MNGPWRFTSEDAESISLHDCRISSVEEIGVDLVLSYADGFDVARDHPLNPTGRHRNTGPSAMLLENWCFMGGTFGGGQKSIRLEDGSWKELPLPTVPISREIFLGGIELEVLNFTWDREAGRLELSCDCCSESVPPEAGGFAELTLGCDRLLFCWNELPRDAWFQDWPK